MDTVERNVVRDALGVGLYCNDRSICRFVRNTVVGTRPDPASGNRLRRGVALLASFESEARIWQNRLVANPVATTAVTDSLVRTTAASGW